MLAGIQPLAPLQLPLTDAYGCVVAQDVLATHDLPEFASSAMDGFAVRASDLAGATPTAPAELKIVGRALIGHEPEGTVGAGETMHIATGAPVPAGADAIVPIENADRGGGTRSVARRPRAGDARPAARRGRPRRRRAGPRGKRLGAPELGLLASAGHPTPLVHPRPRVVVLSTGDELVSPTETPAFGQVRDANSSRSSGRSGRWARCR